jgi:cobalt-zinc-cadmium efflux system membrane fusion protein
MKTTSLPIVLALLVAAQASCRKESAEAPAEPAKAPEDPGLLTLSSAAAANARIGTRKAGPATLRRDLTFQGEVRAVPEKIAAIVARLEGIVTKVSKKEGDKVKKGEAMVNIESKKLAETKLAYLEAEHRLEFAEEALEREAKLMEKRISSKEAYQKVAHEKEEAEINHAAAIQQLRLLGFSESWLHTLEKNPNQKMTTYTLRAPFDGEVIDKDVTMGEAVVAEKTLFNLADLSELLVEIKVPMSSVPLFEKGVKAEVTCDVLDLKTAGTVVFVASMADSETRTVPVKVAIPNTDGRWRPGMPARVAMANAALEAAVAVPLGAVHEIGGKPSVFVKAGAAAYRLVPVTVGEKDDALQEIRGGLEAGAEVAVGNSLALKSEWLKREGE